MKKRLLSLFLAVVMVLGMLPVSAFALSDPAGLNIAEITDVTEITATGETIEFSLWGMEGYSAEEYIATVPAGTGKVTITFQSGAHCAPYEDYNTGGLKLSGCVVTGNVASGVEHDCAEADGLYSIELDVASMVESGSYYGAYDESYNVLYLLGFQYGEEQKPEVTEAPAVPEEPVTATVWFSVTKHAQIIEAEGTPMALVQMTVPYFDIGLYGLEAIYYNPDCYAAQGGAASQVGGTPETAEGVVTILHVLIWATEVYYNGLDEADAGKGWLANEGGWNGFSVDNAPGSAFITFWSGFGSNLNYYLNYEYPLAYPGWGSTCDQIPVADGDVISVRYNRNTGNDGLYYHFNNAPYLVTKDVLQGNMLNLTLFKCTEDRVGYSTGHKTVGEGERVYVVSEIGGEVLAEATTNAYGDVRLDTSKLAVGTYYVLSETFDPAIAILNVVSNVHTHNYSEIVTEPTCTEGGYTTFRCSCGDEYKGNYTAPLDHDFEDGSCSRCGATATVIPEGAPFLNIVTDEDKPVIITQMDGYYKVEVPLGTSHVNITYPDGALYVDEFGYVKTNMIGFDGVSSDGYGKAVEDGRITVGLNMEKAPSNGAPGMIELANVPFTDDPRRVGLCKADGTETDYFAFTYILNEGEYFAVLPEGVGYTVTGEPVASDGYTFRVAIENEYEATAEFAVKINGETVATEPGDITVDSVTEDLYITVEGVAKVVANTDISYTLDLTDCDAGIIEGWMEYMNTSYEGNSLDVEAGKLNTLALPANKNMMISLYLHSVNAMVVGWEINGEYYEQESSYLKQSIGNGNTVYMDKGYFKMDNKGTEPCIMVVKPVLDTNHVHVYDQSVANDKYLKNEATCQHAAEYYKSCVCGEFADAAETFFDGGTVLCAYENGVCKWCATAEPEPEETTSFFTVTLNDEAKTPVTLYQQGEDYCWNMEDAVPKLVVFVPEGTDAVCLNADGELNVLYATDDPETPEDYLGAFENPVLDLTQGYEYYGIWTADWSEVIHLYIEVAEETPGQPHIHDYVEAVVEPTCTEGGYTTYTCSCGDQYKGNYTSPLDHNYENGSCTRCGITQSVIPEGAAFLDILTSDGKPVTVTDLGLDPFYGMGNLYKVEVPVGTTQVNVTFNEEDLLVDDFGYARAFMVGFSNATDDGYPQSTGDGKTVVGLSMNKAAANGSSQPLDLLNIPYPEDPYELRAVALTNDDQSIMYFFAFTYALEEGQFYAQLPTSFMYTVTGDGVASNGYTFNVSIKDGYEATEDFAILVNGEIVATEPGDITVDTVTEDLYITVEGVDKIYNADTDYSITVDLTEFAGEIDGSMWLNKRNGATLELPLVVGKKTSITVDASELWQMFATIYEITPAEGYEFVGYEIDGELQESDGYLSYGCNYQSAAPGKHVIKPVVKAAEAGTSVGAAPAFSADCIAVTDISVKYAEVDSYAWDGDTLNVVLAEGTAPDAAVSTVWTIAFNNTAEGATQTIFWINGTGYAPGTLQGTTEATLGTTLVDGKGTITAEFKNLAEIPGTTLPFEAKTFTVNFTVADGEEPEQPDTGIPYTVTVNGENVELVEAGEDMCSGAYNVPKYELTLPAGATSFTINAHDGLFIMKADSGSDVVCSYGASCTIEYTGDTFYCVNGYRPDGTWFETHLYVTRVGHIHDYDSVVTAPTCTEGGYTTYTCECGDSYIADETPALGHNYECHVTAPSCTEEGVKTYTCTVCGDTYTETVPATGHTEGEVVVENEIAATCTEDGSYDNVVYCDVCGEELRRETVVVEATGHDYQDGVCGSCGEADPDYEKPEEPTVPSTPIKPSKPNWGSIFEKWFGGWWDKEECDHSYTSVVTDPTCTKKGYTTHTCTECGDSYKDSYVAAAGHHYEDGVCGDCGAKDPNANKPSKPGFGGWFGWFWPFG